MARESFDKINRSVWELQRKVRENRGRFQLRVDLLRFFHESLLFTERRAGVREEERSFLLLQKREALCCLLLHGASGSPAEMRRLGEHLFRGGYTVYGLKHTLAKKLSSSDGIGSIKAAFRRGGRNTGAAAGFGRQYGWSGCIKELQIALELLLDYTINIYVIGFSFGGTLALDLVKDYPVKGLILISPAIFTTKTPKNLIFRLLQKTIPFAARSIAPLEDVVLGYMERTRKGIDRIDVPMLVVQASDDPVISRKGFKLLKERSVNPKSRFVIFEGGEHLLVEGEVSDRVFELCSDFIRVV